MHVRERLEVRQFGFRQLLRVADQREHLDAPLLVQTLPMLVVVERALLELVRAPLDLRGIGDRVAADVDTSVDDAVIDPERRRQAMHARVRGTQRAVRCLRRDHVERRHRLREVHRVVEPEAVVVGRAELDVIGIGRLRALGPRDHLERARSRKTLRLDWLVQDHSPTRPLTLRTLLVAASRRPSQPAGLHQAPSAARAPQMTISRG